jgi:spore maturation protein CgeB
MYSDLPLNVLYVGSFGEISTSRQRSEALAAIGVSVHPVDGEGPQPRKSPLFRVINRLFGFPFHRRDVGQRLIKTAAAIRPDVVWFDKAVFVGRDVLASLHRLGNPLLVHYNPDDPFGRARGFWSIFVQAIPEYDVHFVPRRENVSEYRECGAAHVIPFDRGFCPRGHRPPAKAHPRWQAFAAPVAFTGSHERERSASIARLIANGIDVAIRGSLWERAAEWPALRQHYRGGGVGGEDYALALGAPQITLHFLRHANRDEQDSRTFEIPACGGFMMAEWSPRHAELFEEDKEAVFFRNDDELIDKVRHYLKRPDECAAIAARGRSRALQSGYDYESRMRELLTKALAAAGRDDLLKRFMQGAAAS